jgi:hypothetical protein
MKHTRATVCYDVLQIAASPVYHIRCLFYFIPESILPVCLKDVEVLIKLTFYNIDFICFSSDSLSTGL